MEDTLRKLIPPGGGFAPGARHACLVIEVTTKSSCKIRNVSAASNYVQSPRRVNPDIPHHTVNYMLLLVYAFHRHSPTYPNMDTKEALC
jgi:hypothetical protein